MVGKELGNRLAVLAMLRHANVETLQPHVQQKRILRRLNRAKITHKLRGGLGDKRAFQPKAFGIHHAMVAFVGCSKTRELIGMSVPVELAGINNAAANTSAVAVHVFRGGMGDDIGAPFEGTAIYRRGERVVHDQRHTMRMSRIGKTLDIQDIKRWVCNSFAENRFGVRAKCRFKLIIRAVRRNKGALQTHACHGVAQQIVRTAVDSRRSHYMVALPGDIEHSKEICRLPR